MPYNTLSWRSSLMALTVTTVTVTSTYLLYQCVSEYGWEGTFWYIWEGDPYPPLVREDFHKLDDVEDQLQKQLAIVERLEIAYEKAQLDSVDGASPSHIRQLWNQYLLASHKKSKTLEQTLGGLSDQLDRLAAQVDAVPSRQQPSLKARKKELSSSLVQVMHSVDTYCTHFQEGQSSTTTASKPSVAK